MPTAHPIVNRDLLTRIQMEYLEMPGLCLTSGQARRFWNLEQRACDEILATLVRERFLAQTGSGGYLRRDAAPPTIPSRTHA
jgi:hypothetical protein